MEFPMIIARHSAPGSAWHGRRAKENLVVRAGVGLYWNDLAQNGWVTAFQAVNEPGQPCLRPGDAGCLPGAIAGGSGALIDPNYHTPYALHASAGVQYAFTPNWTLSGDYIRVTGMHAYRAYDYIPGYSLFSPLYPQDPVSQQANVPDIQLYKTDNRSAPNHSQPNRAVRGMGREGYPPNRNHSRTRDQARPESRCG